ncbi:hypothetical protein QCA50_002276 [Cerrena zonata]|uniref:F-box domain-containing protein n=1 Tax=Cerrena zonata TaxID=2478898 RepID=A0AAW0GYW1_9APHY
MDCLINTRIPEELLAEFLIFWASVDEDGPWMASAVCKYWRRVVLSNPKAWNKISLIFKSGPSKVPEEWCIEEDDLERAASPRARPRPLPLWLERSGNLPLSIHLYMEFTYPKLNDEFGKRLGDLMLLLGRARHLKIDADSDHLLETICNLFAGRLPKLHTIWLNSRGDRRLYVSRWLPDEPQDLTVFWSTFDGSQNLRSIVSRGLKIPAPPTHSPIMQLITDFDTDVPFLTSEVSNYPNLTTLRLHSGPAQWSTPNGQTPALRIPLHSLTTLSLGNINAVAAAYLLQEFDTPNLLCFTLGGNGDPLFINQIREGAKTYDLYSDMGNSFKAFATRSPKIRELHLTHTLFPDRYLIEVLRQLDDLQELHFTKTYVGTPVLRALARLPPATESRKKQFICPRLQRLKFVGCNLVKVDQLIPLIRARNTSQTGSVPIRKLTLNFCEDVHEEGMERIRAVSRGLVLRFKPPVDVEEVDEEEDEEAEAMNEGDSQGLTSISRVRFAHQVELDDNEA